MKRKIPETITELELIDILKAEKKNCYKLTYLLGFYQAMRVSEVSKLQPGDINKGTHIIFIKAAKGDKDRQIPIIKPLKLKPKTVLYSLKHLPIGKSDRSLQRNFKEMAKKVLGKDLHFHTLRHSGASWLLNKKKWDLKKVQQFLGHEDIQTTQIYLHVSPQDLVDLEWGDEDL